MKVRLTLGGKKRVWSCCRGQCGARRQFPKGHGTGNAATGNGRTRSALLWVGLAVAAAETAIAIRGALRLSVPVAITG